jgi:hypothetical protein
MYNREATDAGAALRSLEQQHRALVLQHNLDFDFVRREWATILDTTQRQAELCARNVEDQEDPSADEEEPSADEVIDRVNFGAKEVSTDGDN